MNKPYNKGYLKNIKGLKAKPLNNKVIFINKSFN